MNLAASCLFYLKRLDKHISVHFTKRNLSSFKDSRSDSIEIGNSVSVERQFTSEEVAQFSKLTGDDNPLHLNDSFARNYKFSKSIVHGALINGVISATIGTILPGHGSILLEQNLHFPNPLYIDEKFVTTVTIVNRKRNIYFCKYECTSKLEEKKTVVYGLAKVMFSHSNQH